MSRNIFQRTNKKDWRSGPKRAIRRNMNFKSQNPDVETQRGQVLGSRFTRRRFLAAGGAATAGLVLTMQPRWVMATDPPAGSGEDNTKRVIKTMTTVFDCPAIDHTIQVQGNTYYAFFIHVHEQVRAYLDSLNPVPTVTGPTVTWVTIPNDAMRTSTTFNGSPFAPPNAPNQNTAGIILSEPQIVNGVWTASIRILHPGGAKTSSITYHYHSNSTGLDY